MTGFYENKRGEHALHIACQNGNLNSVRTLLNNGAAIKGNAKGTNGDGRTVLHSATFSGQEDIVQMLLHHFNASNSNTNTNTNTNSSNSDNIIDCRDNDGKTALLLAIEQGHFNIITLLLKNGANVQDTDNSNNSALHILARRPYQHTNHNKKQQEQILKMLLERGVKLYEKNNHHKTPLHHACSTGNLAIVQMILTNKHSNLQNYIHSKDKNRNNALHIASYKGHIQIVKLLIRHGANIHYKNAHGCTALDIANYNQHPQIVELLLGKKYSKIYNTMLQQKQEGDVYFHNHENYTRAAKIYQKALHLGNQDIHSYSKQPWMYNTTRRKLHAILHCQRAICLMRLGQYDESLEECNATLDIWKQYQNAIVAKARCFAHLEKYEESIWEYNRYIHLVKNNVIVVQDDKVGMNNDRDANVGADIDKATALETATTETTTKISTPALEKDSEHKHEYKNGTSTSSLHKPTNHNDDNIAVSDIEYQTILKELSNVQEKQKSKDEHKKEQEYQNPSAKNTPLHRRIHTSCTTTNTSNTKPNSRQRKISKKKVGNNIIMNLQDKPESTHRPKASRYRTASTNTASTATSTISSSSSLSSVARHYAVLQVQTKDSESRIKEAYQEMALQYQCIDSSNVDDPTTNNTPPSTRKKLVFETGSHDL